MRRKIWPWFAVVLGSLGLAACDPGDGQAAGAPSVYPYRVTCTVGMITDVVRQLAGGHAEVEGLIGEGVDPHLYKPTAPDVKALRAADLVFYNGLMLEGKMGDVLVKVARNGKPVHAVTETILEQGGYVISNKEQHHDPHVWMDVGGWKMAAEVIARALGSFDSSHRADYESRLADYRSELDALEAYAKRSFSSIPEGQRVLVTAHDAFNYMARAYGLEVRAIQGLSTESEAGVKDIEELVDFLVERKIPAVFVESSVSDKNVRALVEGAQARGHAVRIGGELFSDAMGHSGTYEGTYVGMIDHNITTIVQALGGEVPAKGMQGKLSGSHEQVGER